jgi:hypothetical protein
MAKPTSDDEVAGMIRQAISYFEHLEREWVEAPDYASGVARVQSFFKNGQNCMRIALEQGKRLEKEESEQNG